MRPAGHGRALHPVQVHEISRAKGEQLKKQQPKTESPFTLAVGPQVLEFVDEHGNEVLNLGSFTLLPQHVVRLVLCREELKADEFTKFQVHTSPPPPAKKNKY